MTISPNEDIFYEGGHCQRRSNNKFNGWDNTYWSTFYFWSFGESLWVRYKITTRRISVTGGWLGRDKTQVVYSQIAEIRAIPRGLGSYGDMVLVLKMELDLK